MKCIINAIEKKMSKVLKCTVACCLSKAFEIVWRLVHHLCITFKNPFFKRKLETGKFENLASFGDDVKVLFNMCVSSFLLLNRHSSS